MLAETFNPTQFPETELLTWIRSQPGLADVLDYYSKDPRLVKLLQDISDHHPETYAHSLRTSYVAFEIAKATNPDLALVCAGDGLFHDSGKLSVPEGVLQLKNLTGAQQEILRRHPRQSFELLKGIDEEMARVVAAHHELQPDGYPRKSYRPHLKNPQLERRIWIQACADEAEAMMSKRPYKNAWCGRRTTTRLRGRFNPSMIQVAVTARTFIETHGPN